MRERGREATNFFLKAHEINNGDCVGALRFPSLFFVSFFMDKHWFR
jgi:hypothetical protein